MGCLIIGCIVCLIIAFAYWWVPGWVIFWIGVAIILAILAVVAGQRR